MSENNIPNQVLEKIKNIKPTPRWQFLLRDYSVLKFLLITLPYFWLVFLLLFLLAAYYNFKNTKQGYKFPFYKISLISILSSMLIGVFLYNLGIAQAIEDSFN